MLDEDFPGPFIRLEAMIYTRDKEVADTHLVELLIIAESAAMAERATCSAYAISQALLDRGQDTVDVCAVLGSRQAMLIRTTRRDFDAAVDALTPMLVELRAVEGIRVEMESKHHAELTERPITRHLA